MAGGSFPIKSISGIHPLDGMSDILLLYPAGGGSVNAEGPLFLPTGEAGRFPLRRGGDFAIMQSNRPLRAAGEGWDVQADVLGDHQRVQSPVRLLPRHPAAPAAMTPEEFRQLATRLRPYGTYLMLHVMGEPLLHPQLGSCWISPGSWAFGCALWPTARCFPRQLPTLEGSPALHKLSVSLHSFEGSGRQDAAAPYLEGVWQAAQRLSSRGVLCALRLWNGGGLDRRNEEILSFLSEKLGRDVTALPTDRLGNRRLGEGLFLEPGERFDWPDPAAPDSGTEFCHGLRSQIAVLCDGTVVPLLSGQRGAAGAGKPAPAGAGGDTGTCPRATAMATGFSRRQPSEELCRRCGYAARFSR